MASTSNSLKRIESLKARFANPAYEEDRSTISQWESELRELITREKLLENESITKVLLKISQDIKDMNELLMTGDSTQLPDKDRDRVLDRRNLYRNFISLFDVQKVRARIAEIDKEVADNLSSLPDEKKV